MKKIILMLFSCVLLQCSKDKINPELSDAMMIKHIPGYKGMSTCEQKKSKVEVLKGMRRGAQLQRLLELDDIYDAGGVVGPQMKQMDKEFCVVIDSINKQILLLEKQIKSEKCSLGSKSSIKFRNIGEKIGKGFKYTWNTLKSCCCKVKSKISALKNKKQIVSTNIL